MISVAQVNVYLWMYNKRLLRNNLVSPYALPLPVTELFNQWSIMKDWSIIWLSIFMTVCSAETVQRRLNYGVVISWQYFGIWKQTVVVYLKDSSIIFQQKCAKTMKNSLTSISTKIIIKPPIAALTSLTNNQKNDYQNNWDFS